MRKGLLFQVFLCITAACSAHASDLPAVTHYGLAVRFDLKEHRVRAVARLTVKNATKEKHLALPFLLYRLLAVEGVEDQAGKPVPFTQTVAGFLDEPSLQARRLDVKLAHPMAPGDSITLAVAYSGFIFGYPEVMAYVKDRIDEKYSLLRPDAFAYPILAEPTQASARAASDTKFTYDLSMTVPKGYRAACGGALVDSLSGTDSSTYMFRSKVATWRIDAAVAKFSVLDKPDARLTVYYMPEDSEGARRVLGASRDVIAFYIASFGRPPSYNGYSIIEIPDGWGSQAGDYYFLQSAAAFKDSQQISEVYHEIGHSWNAKASGQIQRCRYFDEAFASFFESIAIRHFRGKTAFEEDMEKSRDHFAQWARYDSNVASTPIAGYGAKELGRHSYTKGAWSLYILYRLVGEETFDSIIRAMLGEFSDHTIDFGRFQKLCERESGRDLSAFFKEWIHGVESSRLMVEKVSVADIVKRY